MGATQKVDDTEIPTTLTSRDGCALAVRRLRQGDALALRAFDAALSPDTRRKFLPHAYDDGTLAKALRRSEDGDDTTFGAFDGPRLVAYFFLWYARERVPLLGIGMLDEFQHRGLGRRIMGLLIDMARRLDSDGVELTTMLDNDHAFALYRKMGFEYLGDVENVQGDGKVVVERAMFLQIKPGARPMDGPHAPPV